MIRTKKQLNNEKNFRRDRMVTHKKLDEIMFDVQAARSKDLFPMWEFSENTAQTIYSPTLKKELHKAPMSYNLVPNSELILPIRDKIASVFGPKGFRTVAKSFDNRQFFVDFYINESVAYVDRKRKDGIVTKVSVTNSYDGELKQRVDSFGHRLVCENGLMAFSSELLSVGKHLKGVGVLNLSPLMEKIEKLQTNVVFFRALDARKMTMKELDEVVDAVKESKSVKYPVKMTYRFSDILKEELDVLGKKRPSAWDTYNLFNRNLNENNFPDSNLMPEERVRIDKKVLNTIFKTLNIQPNRLALKK